MNHFVFRVLGIVLVVVINSEIGASVAYGGDCSSTACTDTTTNACIGGVCACATTHFRNSADSACETKKNPDIACTAAGQCITNAECDVGGTDKCECNAGYTETPTVSPTTCSGVVKFATLPYMYVVPILVSMMFLLR